MKSARLLVCLVVACSHPAAPTTTTTSPKPAPPPPRAPVTISIIGTNDLHGAVDRLPLFAGYIANLRAARAADGGGVVLVDGGDMFQGTLESNLAEGADVVKAYNQIGYAAVAVGNHELDYGPVGPAVIAQSATDDPRGALKTRASEAKYPFVVSNILDAATGARVDWPNMPAATLIEVAGIQVGIIGASTESTPYTTMPANFLGLKMTAPAPAITEQAQQLRARGAQVIIATMHIGSSCKQFDNPDDLSSCEQDQEVFQLIAGLPPGTVDVIVGGHTHAGMAHRIQNIAVIESFSSGRAFGRVDLQIGPDGRVIGTKIAKPHAICPLDKNNNPPPVAECTPGDYEGKPVVADPEVQKIADAAAARAAVRRKELLGVTLTAPVTRAHGVESPEGNLLCDLMLAARPDAQVSVTNGGGLRADLPAGQLTYGQLFAAVPFDNRFAILDVTGRDLRTLVEGNLQRGGGFLSWGGLTAKARCKGDKLDVQIRVAGKPLVETARYKLATSDFLASGGDGMIGRLTLPPTAIRVTDVIIRDALADVLRGYKAAKATIDPAKLVVAGKPRLDYPGKRPVTCGAPADATPANKAGATTSTTPMPAPKAGSTTPATPASKEPSE
ncbi:MAG: 5'-nucleotidase C-terminal domain-containing protein [Myxococcales bacterium]|nr:5'-nucleotidase C-terminal domain-containing protein [Myxococcales bacterium]